MADAPPSHRAAGGAPLRLFLCGDVMTGRGIDQALPNPSPPWLCEPAAQSAVEYVELAEDANGPIPRPAAFPYIWGDALKVLNRLRPDLRIINLETAVTTSEDCLSKGINYRMHPRNVPCLTAAGIDCCVLGNNHVLDWGSTGLIETLDTLKRAGLRCAGAGRDTAEAGAPAILDIPHKGRVLVFAYGLTDSGIPQDWAAREHAPGVNLLHDLSPANVDSIERDVAQYKRPGDVAVASIHWGGNWGYRVPNAQIAFAHGLIDAAAIDIVHGHSSHHPKAIEIYEGKPILYGCGDFLNDYEGIAGYEEFRDDLVLGYFLDVNPSDATLAALTLVPFRIARFRLGRASPPETNWLRATMDRECRRFGARVDLRGDGTLAVALR